MTKPACLVTIDRALVTLRASIPSEEPGPRWHDFTAPTMGPPPIPRAGSRYVGRPVRAGCGRFFPSAGTPYPGATTPS